MKQIKCIEEGVVMNKQSHWSKNVQMLRIKGMHKFKIRRSNQLKYWRERELWTKGLFGMKFTTWQSTCPSMSSHKFTEVSCKRVQDISLNWWFMGFTHFWDRTGPSFEHSWDAEHWAKAEAKEFIWVWCYCKTPLVDTSIEIIYF